MRMLDTKSGSIEGDSASGIGEYAPWISHRFRPRIIAKIPRFQCASLACFRSLIIHTPACLFDNSPGIHNVFIDIPTEMAARIPARCHLRFLAKLPK